MTKVKPGFGKVIDTGPIVPEGDIQTEKGNVGPLKHLQKVLFNN